MYMSSSELQYIVELSGQRLLYVPNTDNVDIPVSKRLQLLRDKAHAWFKVDAQSFETVSLPRNIDHLLNDAFLADGHIYIWDKEEDMATIVPILPKPSQKTFRRDWPAGTLFSVPNSRTLDVFMDPAQNLIATAYVVADDETVYIELRDLGSDSVHPQAIDRTLSVSLPEFKGESNAKLKGYGSYIALLCRFVLSYIDMWQLNIWNWQHSTTSNSVLKDCTSFPPTAVDFCFLGSNRLLVVDDDLQLYSIEDMSQTPQLLARFVTPVEFVVVRCFLPVDHIEHSSPQTKAQQTTHTSDPQNRLLCITTKADRNVYIISTRIFFNLDRMAATTSIPWERWGPSNTRIFRHRHGSKIHINGNRVLQAFPDNTLSPGKKEYTLHMMDFSPLAVTNRRGLGRVKELYIDADDRSDDELATSSTTSMSYVEVIFTRKFGTAESQLLNVWVDKDRIYLLNRKWGVGFALESHDELEVIDV